MGLFGRRRREERNELPAELPSLSVLDQTPILPMDMMPPPAPAPAPVVKQEPERPAVAPLFVKMDRYRDIISTIGNLKTAVMIVKNSLVTLHQIEKARDDTFDIINDIVKKVDDKLIDLDNNLLRPAGFHESAGGSSERHDIRGIEATVTDLQGQIEQLKSELGKMLA